MHKRSRVCKWAPTTAKTLTDESIALRYRLPYTPYILISSATNYGSSHSKFTSDLRPKSNGRVKITTSVSEHSPLKRKEQRPREDDHESTKNSQEVNRGSNSDVDDTIQSRKRKGSSKSSIDRGSNVYEGRAKLQVRRKRGRVWRCQDNPTGSGTYNFLTINSMALGDLCTGKRNCPALYRS